MSKELAKAYEPERLRIGFMTFGCKAATFMRR